MRSGTRRGDSHALAAITIGLALSGSQAWAADYCCICKGKTTGKTLSASDDFTAGAQCSLECRRATLAKPGKCETAPATAPAATAPAGDGAGILLLFASEDCSGSELRVSATTPKVAGGMRSFRVESGGGASVWQQGDFGGPRTQPVGAGICVSPGWEIGSVRFEGR